VAEVLTDEDVVDITEQLRFLRVTAKFKYAKDEFYMVGKVMHDAAKEIERLRAREKMLLDAHTGCGCDPTCKVCLEKGYT